MDIQSIQAFLSVSDTGSFSRAADVLYLTQPAISKRIQVLEHALGVTLFDRIGKSVSLTEAGRALLPSCRRIIEEVAESQRIISNLRESTGGILSLATSHHIGLHRLPPVLREYSSRFPDVELKLGFMDSEKACQQIISGELELAIITLPEDAHDRLELMPLWHDSLHIAVSKHHALAAERTVSLKQLRQHASILPSRGTYTRQLIDDALGFDASNKVLLETHYLETIKAMVQSGLGWSMLPRSMFDASLAMPDIKKVRAARQLGAVTHSMRTTSNAAKAMINLLMEYSDRPQNE